MSRYWKKQMNALARKAHNEFCDAAARKKYRGGDSRRDWPKFVPV